MIRVVHPGSRIRMLTFYPSRIPDHGRIQGSNRHRIPDTESATLFNTRPLLVSQDRHLFLTPLLVTLHAMLTMVLMSRLVATHSLPLSNSSFIPMMSRVSSASTDQKSCHFFSINMGLLNPHCLWRVHMGISLKKKIDY
jgi:hypothetical protein